MVIHSSASDFTDVDRSPPGVGRALADLRLAVKPDRAVAQLIARILRIGVRNQCVLGNEITAASVMISRSAREEHGGILNIVEHAHHDGSVERSNR